jgi:hypothetical protein
MAFENYLSKLKTNKEFSQSLNNALKRAIPGSGTMLEGESDANIADFALLISGLLVAAATRGQANQLLNLYMNGKSFTLDTTTNILQDYNNMIAMDSIADAILKGLVATGIGALAALATGSIAIATASLAVGFFAGNVISSFAPDFFDGVFGSVVNVMWDEGKNKAAFVTNSLVENAFGDYWEDNDYMGYYVRINRPFEFKSFHEYEPFAFSFENKTFQFNLNRAQLEDKFGSKKQFEVLMSYLSKDDFSIQTLDKGKQEITHNFLSHEYTKDEIIKNLQQEQDNGR